MVTTGEDWNKTNYQFERRLQRQNTPLSGKNVAWSATEDAVRIGNWFNTFFTNRNYT
jgi:hypothetical protein